MAPYTLQFDSLFDGWARRVRSRLLLRRALTGAAASLVLALIPAAIAWKTGHGTLRAACGAIGVVGVIAGIAIGRRKQWGDVEVALWLDERLDTEEAITTAIGLRNADARDALPMVLGMATRALSSADPKRASPSVVRPMHALAPLAAGALVLITRATLPAVPVAAQTPGVARVHLSQVLGLKKVMQLGRADARDEGQRRRLDALAAEAARLRADLEKGLEKRDALARVAQLRDAIAAERLTLGDGDRRAGLEAALSKLQDADATKTAAKALGDHDLEKMDREMERIANLREKRDRSAAKKALEEAAAAARANGAPDVAKALEQERKRLEEDEGRAELLRDLEKAMEEAGIASDGQKQQAEALDRAGSREAARKLANAMAKALETLTPEERRKLGERLKRQMRKGGSQSEPQDLKDLAEDLSSAAGQKKLEDELKDLANDDEESPESKRQHELDDAEQGAEGAEGEINGRRPSLGMGPGAGTAGGEPIPLPRPGSGQGTAEGDGSGGPSHHDTGTGGHEGLTAPVGAESMKSRARGPMNRAAAMPGKSTGWVPGKSGGTANTQGTGALGTVGPSEIDGVDHNQVPAEYREQVRQYFQP